MLKFLKKLATTVALVISSLFATTAFSRPILVINL